MPSILNIIAASCLTTFFLSTLTVAAPISQLDKRQGCPSVEPNDPNCLLPFWTNQNMNLTFDDLKASGSHTENYNSLNFTGFTVSSPETSSANYLVPASAPNYLRLHANNPGVIAPDTSMSFFKIMDFSFGCSKQSASTTKEVPQSCTLTVAAMCAGPKSSSILDVEQFVTTYDYAAPANASIAELQYATMGTDGERYECYNYTFTAEAAGGKPAVLFLDQMNVVEYFASNIF